MSTNIQLINAKFSELEAFVFELQSINLNFSIICLQESWLYEHEDTSLIELDGYNRIAQGKTCSTKGGLIMYIHKNVKYKLIKYNVSQEHWEGQFVVTGGGLNKYVIIGHIYTPPRYLNVDYRQFTDEFATLLALFHSSNKKGNNSWGF